MQNPADRFRKWCGPGLFLLALVVYLVTLSPGPFPGLSARLIVLHAGLDPFPPLAHPLWTAAVRLVKLLPFASLAVRLNVFSAVCGALGVWLFYLILASVRHDRTVEENMARVPAGPVQTLSGAVGALLLAFSIPYWMVSTRAHPAAFDLLLLFAATYLLRRFRSFERKNAVVYLFCFLYGLGTTEYATFILLGPLYALALLFLVWQAGMLRPRTFLLAACCFLAGTSPYYLFAWAYRLSPAFEWREFETYGKVLWFVWREQYLTIVGSVPRVGWLLLLLTSLAPWVIVLGLPRQAERTRRGRVGTRILYGALTALALALLYHVRIAPWAIFGISPLLVMPYVLIACWAGYLAGYWYIVVHGSRHMARRPTSRTRSALRLFYLPLLVVLLGVAFVLNAGTASGRLARRLCRFSDIVVENLDGRTWLVTRGVLDDNIILSAFERGAPLRVLNLQLGTNDAYLKYVATLFESPHLRGLARLGLAPLLNAWFSESRDLDSQVAVLGDPEVWLANRFLAVPGKVLFLGARETGGLDAAQLFAQHQAFWKDYAEGLKLDTERARFIGAWADWLLGHISKVANNLGVLLEELGRSDLARAAYEEARDLDQDNLSSMLNALSLARKQEAPEAETLEADIREMLGRGEARLNAWALARRHGYVRDSRWYAQQGWAWAVSGSPEGAQAKPAPPAVSAAEEESFRWVLGSLTVNEQMAENTEAAYRTALEEDPENQQALLEMARLEMLKRDFPAARARLQRLQELNAPRSVVDLERAMLESLSGDLGAAQGILQALLKAEPENTRAWAVLALVAERQGNEDLIRQCMEQLNAAGDDVAPGIQLAMAQMAFRAGDPEHARDLLSDVIRSQPANLTALELLLQLDVREARRDLAQAHLASILSLDPRNALGNHVLGTLQAARGELHLAEASLRRSVESRPTAVALNDLAWVLVEQGNFGEGRAMAERSLALDETSAAAWDTLGLALLQLDDIAEAEKAIVKALERSPNDADILLHMAEVYERKGMKEDALRLAEPLLDRAAEMAPATFEGVRALVKRIRLGR